jgi:hypothetical protein
VVASDECSRSVAMTGKLWSLDSHVELRDQRRQGSDSAIQLQQSTRRIHRLRGL